jgi:hypothetical protein
MATADKLRKIYEAALRKEDRLHDAKSSARRAKTAVFVAGLDRELSDTFDDQISEAQRSRLEAKAALDAAVEAEALAAPREIPLGTIMEELATAYRGLSPESRPTGKLGILELITKDSEHPQNVLYGRAVVGEVVVRQLLKDRTPGKSYVRAWRMGHWRPAVQEVTK